MEYGGSLALDPPAPKDEVNIIAALKRPDRISSINLTVTTSLLDKFELCAVEGPFLELEDLILLSQDSVPLTPPISFRWGPRLRRLHLTRIAFPGLLRLLYSSRNLVDLRLRQAFNSSYCPIEGLTDALSRMPQLQSLSLHFPATSDNVFPPPPLDQRAVLPALICVDFRGTAKHLERLVLRIDAPRLREIQVALFDKSVFDLSRLGNFIDRIGMHKSHYQARILFSERAITISFTRPGPLTCLKLRLLSEVLSEQLSTVFRTLPHSAKIFNVEDLRISVTRPPNREDSLSSRRWSKFINSFTCIKWLHLDGNSSTDLVRALQDAHLQHKTVPPALHKLYLPHPGPHHLPLSEAVVLFMTSRGRSGYPIGVEYERLYHISEQRGTGTSLCTALLQGLYYMLTDLK